MPATALENHSRLRIICRKSVRSKTDLTVPSVRPSLVDWRLRGDAWICETADALQAVFFGDYRLVSITASPLDSISLNQLFFQIRHRYPRRRR